MLRVALFAVLLVGTLAQDRDIPDDLPFGTSWLTPEQRTEYEKTEKADRGRFLKGLYEQADSPLRTKIREETLPKCYTSWIPEEKLAEIERLHTAGDHETCKNKIRALLEALPDAKREDVESYWEFCAKLWYEQHQHHKGHNHHEHHGRRRLRHSEPTFEAFAAEHLSWLSGEEQTEIKNLHAESKEKARDKLFEILDSATGEKKEKGIEQLRAACRELIVEVLGKSAAEELKTLKESGATNEQLKEKVSELLKSVDDEQKKARAFEHRSACEKVYELKTTSRKRRAHHHDLETKLRGQWAWLTDAQKDEIRKLKDGGKNDEFLLSKVFEYFKDADDKSAAEDGLQTSCSSAILSILGPEKAEELKTFMANGALPEAYERKVKELLSSAPKKTLTKNQESCKSVFTSASRRRRHETGEHHHHTLEEYLESHLSWLTDSEKEQVKQLKQDGKPKEDIQKKILEFFEATTGDRKEKATAALQAGCRELFTHLIGKEKADELKKAKEAGATNDELRAKGDAFIEEITDEKKREEAKFYSVGCRKAFGVKKRHVHTHHRAYRHRRDHHHGEHEKHTLEELFKSYLSWVPEDKQKELLKQKEDGAGREALQSKVMEIFDGLEGEKKQEARAKMQAGCRTLLVKLVGQEKADELKTMKESGASNQEIGTKVKSFIAGLTDEHSKKIAEEYNGACSKVFNVE